MARKLENELKPQGPFKGLYTGIHAYLGFRQDGAVKGKEN